MSEAPASSADTPAQVPEALDDVLLAMDVVDTLRHREQLVLRELDAEGREADLIERLKEIYAAQGIEVPDAILKDGVKALEERRFTYTPPAPSFAVRLAKIYVSREKWWKPVAGGTAAIVAGLGLMQVAVWGPQNAAAERDRVELTETLPSDLATLRSIVQDIANDEGDRLAESLYQDGIAAVEDENAEDARMMVSELRTLREDVAAIYEVRVRYANGADSGFFRVPNDAPSQRNYYLIVEAVSPRGQILTVPVRSEETNQIARVDKWAQRVSRAVFERVADDKGDDQIIQNAVIGEKQSGALRPDYLVETPGGALIEW